MSDSSVKSLNGLCEKFLTLDKSKRNLKSGKYYAAALVPTKTYQANPLTIGKKTKPTTKDGWFVHQCSWDDNYVLLFAGTASGESKHKAISNHFSKIKQPRGFFEQTI